MIFREGWDQFGEFGHCNQCDVIVKSTDYDKHIHSVDHSNKKSFVIGPTLLELPGSEHLKPIFLDQQYVFCLKCKVRIQKSPSRVKVHLESVKHQGGDLEVKQRKIHESNGWLVSNDPNVNSIRCIPCGNVIVDTKTLKQFNQHLNCTNHRNYIEAYEVCVKDDPTFNNWDKARSRYKNRNMYEIASNVSYMRVQMDDGFPFECHYFCGKCNKTLRDRSNATFNKHVGEVHIADSNGFDAMEFNNDVRALFMARM